MDMGRKKTAQADELLAKTIIFRVTEEEYERLSGFVKNGDCHSLAEAARRVLNAQKITLLYKDISMNGPMEELAGIRKELRAIGININQVTRYFNGSSGEQQKVFHALKIAEQYTKVEAKVADLLALISKLAVKWLQE